MQSLLSGCGLRVHVGVVQIEVQGSSCMGGKSGDRGGEETEPEEEELEVRLMRAPNEPNIVLKE